MKLKTPLKRHGGKAYMANEIVALMPPRKSKADPGGWFHYVEPYFGGGSVLLANDPEGISEVVNDLDDTLINFWTVLQHPELFEKFHRLVTVTPFSEPDFEAAKVGLNADHGGDNFAGVGGIDVARAAWFFVLARQSMGGLMKSFAPVAKRLRRGMNDAVSHWLSTVDRLPELHARLRRVLILRRDAVDVIKSQDSPGTLTYADPPYVHATRAKGSTKAYAYEMDDAQHRELLDVLSACKGKVMLSGYRSTMYDQQLAGWNRHDFEKANHAAGGKSKRRMTECVWTNY